MIVLDTNVLSGAIRADKDMKVIAWLDRQNPDDLCTTAITLLEIYQGIEKMSAGKRRSSLEASLAVALNGILNNRVLPFDASAAQEAGCLYGRRRHAGRTVGQADTQIAGIVISRDATLATHNIRDFMDLNVPLIDPWKAA
jgi:toxin FitB